MKSIWGKGMVVGAVCAAAGLSAFADSVKVSSFGFDPADSTEFLQKAIDSGAAEVVVDKMTSPWIVRPIKGRSNLRLVFEPGVEVRAKKGEFRGGGDMLFNFEGRHDVTLVGSGAVLSMNKADYMKSPYSRSEYRHLLNFGSGCRNITLEGLVLRSSGGDGIYFGAGHYGFCSNVVVRNVTVDGHFRQAMSVISVDDMLVENCRFVNTKGTPPAAGIDFEPNFNSHRISRVTVRNCLLENNEGAGIDFHLCGLDAEHSPPTSILVENCVVRGNATGFNIAGNANKGPGVLGKIVLRGCTLEANRVSEYAYAKGVGPCMDVVFENCRVKPKGAASFKAIMPEDVAANTSCPVFVNGTVQILDRPTDFTAAKAIDARPGELVRFDAIRTRYRGTYVFYADAPRRVRFLVQASKIPMDKFNPPTAPFKVTTLAGQPVAEIPMVAAGEVTEISCEVPAAGFYRIRGNYNVGGLLAFCGTDVPLAFDTTQAGQPLFVPSGSLYFEVPSATEDAALGFSGGGPGENVSVRLLAPSGKVEWSSRMVGVTHRFRFESPREAGLWTITFGRPASGLCEDAGIRTFGTVPGCFFFTPEKRWTWK